MTDPYVNLDEQGSIYSDPLDALMFNEFDDQFIDDDYHGAVIDMDGNEQPITEEMILDACAALEKELEPVYGPQFSGK